MAGSTKGSMPTRILIDQEAKLQMDRLVALIDKEIMWVGLVDTVKAGDFQYLRVYDILVPEQTVTSGSVDWEGAMNKLMEEMIATDRADEIENVRFFGHSHAKMSVFHSTVDIKQILDWATVGELDWFISYIQNKAGESECRVDYFKPFRVSVEDAITLTLTPPHINKWAKEQIDKKVTIKSWYQSGTSSTTPSSSDYQVTHQRGRKMFPDAKNVFVQLSGGFRALVVDNEIRVHEDTKDGEISFMDTEAAQRWQQTEEAEMSRSITRSETKRAEGKDQGGDQERLPQTQTASDQGRSSNESSNGKPSERSSSAVLSAPLLQLPPGQSTWADEEDLLTEDERDAQLLGANSTDEEDLYDGWVEAMCQWYGFPHPY